MGVTSMIALASQLASMTGLGGKVGQWLAGEKGEEVASRVIGIAQAVTGAREPEQALALLNQDAAKRTEFEEAIFDHEEALAEIGAADRQDARAMLVEVMASENAGWFARNFVYLMSAVLVLFAIGYSVAVTFVPLTPQGERYADLILNVVIVGGVLGGMLKFFYGGSRPQQRHELGGKTLRGFGDYGK